MNNFFYHKNTTNGISRKKIIISLCVISFALIGIIFYGIFYTQEKNQLDSNNADDYYNKLNTNFDVEEWLNKQKIIPTQGLKNNNFVSENSAIKVPAITDATNNQPQAIRQEISANIATAQIQSMPNNLNSITAKALMFKANLNSGSNSSQSTNNDQDTNLKNRDNLTIESNKRSNILYNYEPGFEGKTMDGKNSSELKAGSVIPAVMINGINSDLPGEVVALVRDNIYDSIKRQYLLIPQGAKLIGLYDSNIVYGQERVLVAWNRVIYPDGRSVNLKGIPGSDLEGYSGFYDQVDNKYWKIFGSSFIIGMITSALQYSQNNTNVNAQITGGVVNNPSVGQVVAGSLGQQLGQTGLMVAQKNLNVQPTLIIRPGYPFNIMLTADLILKP
ncbi:MAG: hypothetical protein ORN24_06865, partial [Burkholderiales bacterium]|nr:hypothetical protein [Burkholderiales bacterium]